MRIEQLIHRGYFAEASDRGDDLPGGGTDDTVDEEVKGQLATEDGEATGDTEEVEKIEPKEPHIPKARFDKAVGKARKEAESASKRAEEAEAKLKAQQGDVDAAAIETEIDDLYTQADQAQADGNKELLKAIRREIREKSQLLSDARAEVKAAYKSAQAIEQIRYDRVVEDMERDHSTLNPDNEEDYDQEAVDEVMELTEAFVAKGEGSAAALKKAIRLYFKGTPEKKEVEQDPDTDRKAEAIKKGLDAKGKQPAVKKVGLDSDKGGKKEKILDPSKINDKDWAALSREEKAAMRGDTL